MTQNKAVLAILLLAPALLAGRVNAGAYCAEPERPETLIHESQKNDAQGLIIREMEKMGYAVSAASDDRLRFRKPAPADLIWELYGPGYVSLDDLELTYDFRADGETVRVEGSAAIVTGLDSPVERSEDCTRGETAKFIKDVLAQVRNSLPQPSKEQ